MFLLLSETERCSDVLNCKTGQVMNYMGGGGVLVTHAEMEEAVSN
jgi:hypothetical protein